MLPSTGLDFSQLFPHKVKHHSKRSLCVKRSALKVPKFLPHNYFNFHLYLAVTFIKRLIGHTRLNPTAFEYYSFCIISNLDSIQERNFYFF